MKLTLTYSNGLSQELDLTAQVSRIPVETPADCNCITARMEIPLRDIQDVWMTNWRTCGTEGAMPWVIKKTFGAQCGFPFCVLMNFKGTSRLAFGSGNLVDDTEITLAINQERCIYELTAKIAITPGPSPFELSIDTREIPWHSALKDWQDSLNIPARTYPADAYEPVFCTWYVTHADVDATRVEALARDASQLGFRTMIVDDGWCYDERKRVTPKTLQDWYAPVGDWKISTAKFPDFKAHVQRVQEMGMKYMLWVAPFMIGRDSEFRAKHPDWLKATPAIDQEGTRHLDVTIADTTGITETLRSLAKENALDGLKIDFIDIVPPNVASPTSRATIAFVKEVTEALKADNANALIEFRQGYANQAMLPFGTQFRAADAPFDWMLNFSRMMEIRLSIGNRAPVHADPAYWGPTETLANVARHMMALCSGVPMLSMPLERLTPEEKAVVRFYIDFYGQHKALINHGEWNILCGRRVIDGATVEKDGERIVYLATASRLQDALLNAPRKTWILNMTDETIAIENAQAFDPTGAPQAPGSLPPGFMGHLD